MSEWPPPDKLDLRYLAYQQLCRDRLCGGTRCPETTIEYDAAGEAVGYEPCRHCLLPALDGAMASPLGVVLNAAIEIHNDLKLGLTLTAAEITEEEYAGIEAIHWAQARREREEAEERQRAAEMEVRRRR
jgi:hypothetical protein